MQPAPAGRGKPGRFFLFWFIEWWLAGWSKKDGSRWHGLALHRGILGHGSACLAQWLAGCLGDELHHTARVLGNGIEGPLQWGTWCASAGGAYQYLS